MNVYTMTGHIGNNAEVRHTQGGTAVCTFSVAVKAGYGDKATTQWIRCNLWGKRAEGGLPQYLVKGQAVCVSGELSVREWEKDGQKNTSVEVRVNEVDLIGEKKAKPASHDGIASNQPSPQNQGGGKTAADFDEDIPFN